MKSGFILTIALVLILSSVNAAAQPSKENAQSQNVNLVLNGGFLHGETVEIRIEYSDHDSIIYSGKLIRIMWVNDHNFFLIPLERGKYNRLVAQCKDRDVEYVQCFRMYEADIYLDLGINLKNQFYSEISDKGGSYD